MYTGYNYNDNVCNVKCNYRKYAFSLLKQAGCWLTTTESAILSLAGGSHHPQFKQLQALIKAEGPDTGLLSKI